jgi:hypothetical protein
LVADELNDAEKYASQGAHHGQRPKSGRGLHGNNRLQRLGFAGSLHRRERRGHAAKRLAGFRSR